MPDSNSLNFRRGKNADCAFVMSLYRSLVGTPFCTWDETYPNTECVADDLEKGFLYLLDSPEGICAAATIRHWVEHDSLAPWRSRNPRDLMRFGVARSCQRRGIGRFFLNELLKESRRLGCDGMRILVAEENLPARTLYEHAGSVFLGRSFSYGVHWLCTEIYFG